MVSKARELLFSKGRQQRNPQRGSAPSDAKQAAAAASVGQPPQDARPEASGLLNQSISAGGVLEMHPKGYGFLRDPQSDYRPSAADVFVPERLVETSALRPGNLIVGVAQRSRPQEGPRLQQIQRIDGLTPEKYARVEHFDRLTPITPESWFRLETGREPLGTRVMDLLTPLGKGQRALVVAPPRTGKTILLQQIGQAIAANYPAVKLFVLLTDERPEEVTEMRRQIAGEVLASSLDCDVESHVRLARLTIERCKRLAETGHDVFLLVDSLTRIARAFNKWVSSTGRTMTGGMDVKALDIPKRLFASARALEEGGSLTIVATALIDTGSRMDELIFQEFKGTGNMELVLDRDLADRRAWPAIDITQSGTRREEKLLDRITLQTVTSLRRTLSAMNPADAMQRLTTQLAKYDSNADFLHFLLTGARPALAYS